MQRFLIGRMALRFSQGFSSGFEFPSGRTGSTSGFPSDSKDPAGFGLETGCPEECHQFSARNGSTGVSPLTIVRAVLSTALVETGPPGAQCYLRRLVITGPGNVRKERLQFLPTWTHCHGLELSPPGKKTRKLPLDTLHVCRRAAALKTQRGLQRC